jgi:hypothetical protein
VVLKFHEAHAPAAAAWEPCVVQARDLPKTLDTSIYPDPAPMAAPKAPASAGQSPPANTVSFGLLRFRVTGVLAVFPG